MDETKAAKQLRVSDGRKEEASDKESATTRSDIGCLNCDCLANIFLFLPIVDRFNAELVCKKWKLASQHLWRSLKRLDVDISKWLANNVNQYTRVRSAMYKTIVEKTGPHLTVIDFTYLCTKADDQETFMLNRYDSAFRTYYNNCTQNRTYQGICALAKYCAKIEKLSLCSLIINCNDSDLYRLFWKNKNISYLNLTGYTITGKCFTGLSTKSITTLLIQRCQVALTENLRMLLLKCTNLKTLSLWRTTTENYRHPDKDIIQLIGYKIIKNLKELYLEENTQSTYTCSLRNFRVLVAMDNLTSIQISSVKDDYIDQILIDIGANCNNLKMADFSGCYNVTDDVLMAITILPKLEVLCIDQLRKITDRALIYLSEHLKVLRCIGCQVTDAGLRKLIKSPNMEILDLSFCKNITNEIVNYAIELTKQRTNKVILKMYVKDTQIKEWEIEKISPFFKLHNAPTQYELLSTQLRPYTLLHPEMNYHFNRFDEKECFQIDSDFRYY